MRFKGQIISFILLLAFGLNVAGDLFASHKEDISPDTEYSVTYSKQQQSSLNSELISFDQGDASSASDACDDQCHVGNCHIGHCSHLVKIESKMSLPTLIASSHGLWTLLVPSSPFLEGPKQPPRHLNS